MRPAWLRVDRLLGEWRIPQDSEAGRRMLSQCVEGRRDQELTDEFRRVERGWCLGDKEFRRELLERVSTPGKSHCGEAVQEAVEVRAERLLAEGLACAGWTEQDLATRRKGDPDKVRLAMALRAHTTMPLAWIAARLKMGSRGYLTWLLQRQKH